MRKIILLSLIFIGIITGGCHSDSNNNKEGLQGDLIIFHAGSLSLPMKVLADSFNIKRPGLKIKPESAGSLTSIRKITELGKDCDILASADASMIDKLMIPEYADFNLEFASNEMVIAYNQTSNLANEITSTNWPQVILKDNIIIGRADPSSDPCGYRTIMSLKLAEKVLDDNTLAERITSKDNRYIRPKEVDLLALLETSTVDYIFIYKSVALQHGLRIIELGDSINLGNNKLGDFYKTVSVEVPGNSPYTRIEIQGEPMVYGITIPLNAPNREAAIEFINFIITEGLPIIENLHQTPIYPPQLSKNSKTPHWITK